MNSVKKEKDQEEECLARRERRPLNRDLTYFEAEQTAAVIVRKARQSNIPTQHDQNMMIYMATYEDIQEDLALHLNALSALPE